MKHNAWIVPCLALLLHSCYTIKPEKIQYNTAKRQYEYKKGKNTIILRNDSNQLVDSTNVDAFTTELLKRGLRYPLESRRENVELLRNSNFKLAQYYSKVQAAIENNESQKALDYIVKMRALYPAIDRYSDCSFLEGYLFEKMGKADAARAAYKNFITYSSQKYSGYFRGHRDDDQGDSMYLAERKHAFKFLQQVSDAPRGNYFKPFQPKYHYTSYQPGFLVNPEDLCPNNKFVHYLCLGWDTNDNFTPGYQFTYLLNEKANINAGVFYSQDMQGCFISFPLQLSKTNSNRFGLKATPFVNILKIDRIKSDGKYYSFDDTALDFGAKISAAQFLNQRLYLGAYWDYHFYNKGQGALSNKTGLEIYFKNEYDVSGYYNVFKNVSLKAGVKNSNVVGGLFLGGVEISYNFTTPGVLIRTDLR